MVSDTVGEHWDEIYSSKRADEVSWFQREPSRSLELLTRGGVLPASVVDVGAGESVLVDHLLARGVRDVTLLDVSAAALECTLDRLGRPDGVHAVVADVVGWEPPRRFAAWHDRAVLHFLTDDGDRARYARVAADAVEPGGAAVIGVFALDGPESCSGLPVRRHAADDLTALLGDAFDLERVGDELHVTPWGSEQHFVWVAMRRR